MRLTVEPMGVTADRLTALADGEDPGMDGWLVGGPWPQNVDAARQAAGRQPLFAGTTTPVANSPLVAMAAAGRLPTLRQACDWLCIAKAAGPHMNIPDPASSAAGVAVLGAVSDELFKGRSFDRNDPDLLSALARLHDATKLPAADAMATVLTTPSLTDLAAGAEAEAMSVLATAADRNGAVVLYPSKVVADVELGTIGASGSAGDLGRLVRGSAGAKALTEARWRVGPPPPGTTTDPGVLAALRSLWSS